MLRSALIVVAALVCLPAAANPFPQGDPKVGKQLHDKACIACHARLVGGDGSEMYTRLDRKINSPRELSQRIAMCNAQTNAGWFPEDEQNVASYLNEQYYKFK